MKKTLSALLLVLVLSACSTTQPTPAPVALGPGSTTPNSLPQKAVTITDRDRGAFVALSPRGTLTVSLEANTAAGYQWKLARPLDPSVLELVSSGGSELPPVALPPGGISKPQAQQWVFKAVGPGTAKVRLIYSRPDQPLDSSVSYDFTVNAE
jgi:predicted secreted protein